MAKRAHLVCRLARAAAHPCAQQPRPCTWGELASVQASAVSRRSLPPHASSGRAPPWLAHPCCAQAVSGGLPAEHFDGVMMQLLMAANWRVKHLEDVCPFNHAPSPQASLAGRLGQRGAHDPPLQPARIVCQPALPWLRAATTSRRPSPTPFATSVVRLAGRRVGRPGHCGLGHRGRALPVEGGGGQGAGRRPRGRGGDGDGLVRWQCDRWAMLLWAQGSCGALPSRSAPAVVAAAGAWLADLAAKMLSAAGVGSLQASRSPPCTALAPQGTRA